MITRGLLQFQTLHLNSRQKESWGHISVSFVPSLRNRSFPRKFHQALDSISLRQYLTRNLLSEIKWIMLAKMKEGDGFWDIFHLHICNGEGKE